MRTLHRWKLLWAAGLMAGGAVLTLAPATWAVPTKITFLAHSGYQVGFDPLVSEFNGSQADVQVDPLYVTGDANVRAKFIAMAAGGIAPDALWHFEGALFASQGLVADLEPFIAREGSRFTDQFLPEAVARYRYQGERYAIPFGINTGFMVMYNKDRMAGTGLPEPASNWTWDGFAQVARKLTQDKDGDGKVDEYGFDTFLGYFWSWLINNDAPLFDRDEQQWYPDELRTIEAVAFATRLVREYGVTPLKGLGFNGFGSGQSAMYGEGNYSYGWLEQTQPAFAVGVAPWPQKRARRMFVGGYGLFIGNGQDAKRREAAWKFIKWLSEPAQQLRYVAVTKQIPSSRLAITSPSYQEAMNRFPAMATYVRELSTYGVAQPIPIGYGDVLGMSLQWAGKAYAGELSPEAAVKGLKDQIRAFYKGVPEPLL